MRISWRSWLAFGEETDDDSGVAISRMAVIFILGEGRGEVSDRSWDVSVDWEILDESSKRGL